MGKLEILQCMTWSEELQVSMSLVCFFKCGVTKSHGCHGASLRQSSGSKSEIALTLTARELSAMDRSIAHLLILFLQEQAELRLPLQNGNLCTAISKQCSSHGSKAPEAFLEMRAQLTTATPWAPMVPPLLLDLLPWPISIFQLAISSVIRGSKLTRARP